MATVVRSKGSPHLPEQRSHKPFRQVWGIVEREAQKLFSEQPGLDYREFRSSVKRIVDGLIELPPIAEEISDIVIAVIVDGICYRVAEGKSDSVIIKRAQWEYLKECAKYVEQVRSK